MSLENRYTGCLIAGAAGDALGYAVEFSRLAQIRKTYGDEGITEYKLTDGRALVSDDTQMTLFTASGLLNASGDKMEDYVDAIRNSYKAWYRTQTESGPIESDEEPLLKHEELFTRRAPGATCLHAIQAGAVGTIENPMNDSKGCGGVMRVAPIGLRFGLSDEHSLRWVDELGAKAAALTHGHPLGYIASAGLVHIVCGILRSPEAPLSDVVNDMLSTVSDLFSGSSRIEKFTSIIEKAQTLAGSSMTDTDAIRQLGEGWVAEETLAIAVFCALRYPSDIDRALRASVNHDGDSDSTGAVTGNILGTFLGIEAIPAKYTEHIEYKDILTDMADALYEVS